MTDADLRKTDATLAAMIGETEAVMNAIIYNMVRGNNVWGQPLDCEENHNLWLLEQCMLAVATSITAAQAVVKMLAKP